MSYKAQLFAFCALTVLACPSLFSQVDVTARTDKSDYIVGEPVFVVVDVKNVGTDPVGYSYGDSRVTLTVEGVEKRKAPNIRNCFRGAGFFGGGAYGSHVPLMKPGESVAFLYLLKEYALTSGDFVLHAGGKAGVRWSNNPVPGPLAPPPPKHRTGDPIPGEMFDVTLTLTVRDGSEEELRRRFAPYVEEAANYEWERRPRAREAIAEMAPTFLEKTILGFAEDPNYANLAVKGLGQIHSTESRKDLVELFDRSADLRLRCDIVRALAEMATPDQFEFFFSLLPGRSAKLDDDIRVYAALGLGQIGGDQAVDALVNAPTSPNPEVRGAIIVALGNTRSHQAFPVLIDLYSDAANRDNVCGALASATHLSWCDGSGEVEAAQSKWRKWWQRNGRTIRLYGPDECPESVINLPSFEQYPAPNRP
jgi:hypothetical protein